jgi:HPP family
MKGSRFPTLDRTQFLAVLAGAAGGAIAIASMEAFSLSTAFPLMAIPFATSIVTVLGSPKAEPAQPRALVGGHLLSTVIGLLVDMSRSFLIAPVGIGALLLALFAFTWHNLVARGANKGDTWPTQWW